MSQLQALNRQLAAWGETDNAAAEIELARGLAEMLDGGEGAAELWREYRFALKSVREALGDDGIDEGVAELLARLGGTDLRNAQDREPD